MNIKVGNKEYHLQETGMINQKLKLTFVTQGDQRILMIPIQEVLEDKKVTKLLKDKIKEALQSEYSRAKNQVDALGERIKELA